jgi:hypothetical protein
LIVYIGLIWAGVVAPRQGTPAEHIGGLVFVQFAGFFVTAVIAISLADVTSSQPVRSVTLLMIVFGVGGFLAMIALTDDLVIAGVWAVSTVNGLLDDYGEVVARAIVYGGWVMVAGFLSALVGSMAGVDPDALLSTNLATVAGWGMLYYAGLLLVTMLEPPVDEQP